jgi:hypothetical protein
MRRSNLPFLRYGHFVEKSHIIIFVMDKLAILAILQVEKSLEKGGGVVLRSVKLETPISNGRMA